MDPKQQPYQYTGMPQVGFSNTQGQVYMPQQPPPPGAPGMMVQWMPPPNPIPGCPPGLEYLVQIDKLFVKQQVELLEETDTCMRICCGAQRSFTMHIVNNLNQEVLRVSREFKCCAGCCWCAGCCDCCSHEVMVSLPTGEVMGYVKQAGSCWAPAYEILSPDKDKVLRLEGPCCIVNGPFCPCENDFKLLGGDGTAIGKISKQYSGFAREMFTSADNFSIEFPTDLQVKVKSTLIGALFLIDFMFFEQKNNNN